LTHTRHTLRPPTPPPQVPIFDVMRKFDGDTVTDDIRTGRRRMRITRLPRCLALHFKRFTKNNFFQEKNPTLVNFPVSAHCSSEQWRAVRHGMDPLPAPLPPFPK
jgi:hypothetical protein